MPYAGQMLGAHPRQGLFDQSALGNAIETLLQCEQACVSCADACLAESHSAELSKCIRLNLDCADICAATARILSRQTEMDVELVRGAVEACLRACGLCASECERHADMPHCALCAERCRACEQACRDLLAAVPS